MWNTPTDSPCLLTAVADVVNAVRAVPTRKTVEVEASAVFMLSNVENPL
jgi:hypothetical protein